MPVSSAMVPNFASPPIRTQTLLDAYPRGGHLRARTKATAPSIPVPTNSVVASSLRRTKMATGTARLAAKTKTALPSVMTATTKTAVVSQGTSRYAIRATTTKTATQQLSVSEIATETANSTPNAATPTTRTNFRSKKLRRFGKGRHAAPFLFFLKTILLMRTMYSCLLGSPVKLSSPPQPRW